MTGVARPGSVLCTQEVRDAAPDRFDWSFARKHKLKGMSEPISLYRARRLGADEPGEHEGAQESRAEDDKQDQRPPGEDAAKTKKRSKADRRRTRAAS